MLKNKNEGNILKIRRDMIKNMGIHPKRIDGLFLSMYFKQKLSQKDGCVNSGDFKLCWDYNKDGSFNMQLFKMGK